ncbi:MAG: hypothetical protein LBC79_05480 [Deltaproteobacteria bacterium]|nr:hypothetical protein [Deltaproteobacteria bacterium]
MAHNDFFAFCKNLLHRYRADERVMHISGSNFQLGLQHGEGSLYFSKIPHCWGWATWAKAWERYETRMEYADMEEVMENVVLHVSAPDVLGWAPELLFRCVGDQVGHWDVRWWYSLMKHDGLAAVPNVNLARNIGFGKDATHTKGKSILGCTPLSSLETIIYPAEPVWDKYADKVDMRIYFGGTMRTPENLKKEIQARIAEGAPAENIRYVMGLGKKLFHEIKQGQP